MMGFSPFRSQTKQFSFTITELESMISRTRNQEIDTINSQNFVRVTHILQTMEEMISNSVTFIYIFFLFFFLKKLGKEKFTKS